MNVMNLLFHQTLRGGRDRLDQLQVFFWVKNRNAAGKSKLIKDRLGGEQRGRKGPDVLLIEEVF